MRRVLKAADVREEWDDFNDAVIGSGPAFVEKDGMEWVAMSTNQFDAILNYFVLEAEYFNEEDGSVTFSMVDLDIAENGETKEAALDKLVSELFEYAKEYQENFNMYFNSSNRQHHLPYVLKILSCDNREILKTMVRY